MSVDHPDPLRSSAIYGFFRVKLSSEQQNALTEVISIHPKPTATPGVDAYEHNKTVQDLFQTMIDQVKTQRLFDIAFENHVADIHKPEKGPQAFRLEPGLCFYIPKDWLTLAILLSRETVQFRLYDVSHEEEWEPGKILFFSATGPARMNSRLYFLSASYKRV